MTPAELRRLDDIIHTIRASALGTSTQCCEKSNACAQRTPSCGARLTVRRWVA